MAEESNKLTRISDDAESPDAVSTAAGATDTYSTGKLGDYPTSDNESLELATNTTDDGDETTEDTEQIRAQIEQTRSQMSETIDAIQERLSMSNIKEQVSDQINSAVETAKDAVYDATIGKAGKFMQNVERSLSGVTENVGRSLGSVTNSVSDTLSRTDVLGTISRNPIPFSLIGLGLGMLVLQARSRNQKRISPSYQYDYDAGNFSEDDYTDGQESRGRSRRSALKSATGKVGSAASSAVGSVGNAASSAVSGVSSAAGSAYQGITSAAGSAYEGIGSGLETVGTSARELAGTAQDKYEYYIEENPLAVGAVALALGAAVGFSIPSTRTESRLVGEYRDELMSKAGDVARSALDKVQQVAGEAARTVQEQTGNQDLVQ